MALHSIVHHRETVSDDHGNLSEVETPEILFSESLPDVHPTEIQLAITRLQTMADNESNFGVSAIFVALIDMLESSQNRSTQ